MTNPETRIEELEAKVAELTALVEEREEPKSSRRNMLKLAGAAAVGGAAAIATKSGRAAAADNDPILIARTDNTTTGGGLETVAIYNSSNPAVNPTVPGPIIGSTNPANLFLFRDIPSLIVLGSSNASAFPAALAGYSISTVANGIFGRTSQGGSGVVGQGQGPSIAGVYGRNSNATAGAGAGVRAQSANGPNVQIETTMAGAPTTGAWTQGAIVGDTTGALWYCTASGTPGTWVNLVVDTDTNNRFVAVGPARVYDSREPAPSPGALAKDATRTLSIKDQRAVAGGAVTTADIIPAGATAISANVTVVNTVLAGFLTVNPGGTTTINAATVNWFATGQILNNGVIIPINPADRTVTVICGGSTGAATDFVIDVTGYFI